MAFAYLLCNKVQAALVRSRVQNVKEMLGKEAWTEEIHMLLSDTGQGLTEPGWIRRQAAECLLSLFSSEDEEEHNIQHTHYNGTDNDSTQIFNEIKCCTHPQCK